MRFARFLSIIVILLAVCAALAAQSGVGAAPTMPSVSSPSMPAMSAFPSMSTSSAPADATQPNKVAATGTTSASALTGVQGAQNQYVTAANLATLSSSLLGGAGGSAYGGDVLSQLLGANTAGASPLSGTQTNLLLQQILEKLTELQETTAEQQRIIETMSGHAPLQQNTAAVSSVAAPPKPKNEHNSNAKILRWTVNGYNVLDTCRTVYASNKMHDGSFLITGDRKYLSDYKTRDETFYFLLTAAEPGTYNVTVSVLQDYKNEYSFLYQLQERSPLTATVIGNLVSLKVEDPTWQFDLLIDTADVRR